MEITPAVVPPPPTCEKKGKDILEEIQDAEVQKEPAPTIYSRLKNVVAEAIQKVWSIFQWDQLLCLYADIVFEKLVMK